MPDGMLEAGKIDNSGHVPQAGTALMEVAVPSVLAWWEDAAVAGT